MRFESVEIPDSGVNKTVTKVTEFQNYVFGPLLCEPTRGSDPQREQLPAVNVCDENSRGGNGVASVSR